ncbi:hypothetical protein [Rhizobium arsenicireducens]
MDIIGSTPAAITIAFATGDLPVAPDVGSVTYTLRDQAGAIVAGLIDVPQTTTDTTYEVQIHIPSAAHNIGAGRRFERRTLTTKFTVGGAEALVTQAYRVVPELAYSVTSETVRAFIGIEVHEMPDDAIDLLSAYLAVEKVMGTAALGTALVSGTTDELSANTLICMRAVLDVLPSAKQRMAQSEKNGVKEFSRVDLKELDKLKIEAEKRYQEALDELVVISTTTVSLFLTTANIDAITG